MFRHVRFAYFVPTLLLVHAGVAHAQGAGAGAGAGPGTGAAGTGPAPSPSADADASPSEKKPATPPAKAPADAADSPDEAEAAAAEAEAAAAEAEAAEAELAEAEAGPKPDATHGVLRGKVTDATSTEELIEVQCFISQDDKKIGRALTDVDGRYAYKLPPGRYTVRCFLPGYITQRIENVEVKANQFASASVPLPRDAKTNAVEEIVVQVDPNRATVATQFMLRKNAANVSDAVSAQDIAKTPDRNAAEATKRVVGATLVDGRFVYVRGLGDRYTNSLLNGTYLPSPEPDLQAIPLDLFPVSVLSDVTIFKTFTPDMPADFAGGSVRIQTRTFPSKFFVSLVLSGGVNTQTTFQSRPSYDGSVTDAFAFDGGRRALPSGISPEKLAPENRAQSIYYGNLFDQHARRISRAIAAPNFSFSATAGGTTQLWGNPLGYLAAVGYGRRTQTRHEEQATFETDTDPTDTNPDPQARRRVLVDQARFTGERVNSTTTVSGMGSLGYQFGRNHRLTATGLVSTNSDDDILDFYGPKRSDAAYLKLVRARWVERQLYFGQLIGEHKFTSARNALLRWNLFLGTARRNEPNNTQTVYQEFVDSEGPPRQSTFAVKNLDGLTHFFSGQTEDMRGGGLDYTQPLSGAERGPRLKMGGLAVNKERHFSARRFYFDPISGARNQLAWSQLPADQIVTPETIQNVTEVRESTRTTDIYRATQDVFAGYLMTDMPVLTQKLRMIGGVRFEYTDLAIHSRDDTKAGQPMTRDGFRKPDMLPSVNVVYALTDKVNVRGSWSQTVARPQFREIARFDYVDFFNAQTVVGNPQLKRALINNMDVRVEWFPASDEVVALSAFYKDFKDPIEVAGRSATSSYARTVENAAGASNFGVELEARKGLGFITSRLSRFSVLGNLTLVDSKVRVAASQLKDVTSTERPLQGQSPWVVNVALDYTSEKETTRARIAYNVFGQRIDSVGYNGLPDIYELPRNVLDLSIAQRLTSAFDVKFAAENILDAPFRFEGGGKVAQRWTLGPSFWLSLLYNI